MSQYVIHALWGTIVMHGQLATGHWVAMNLPTCCFVAALAATLVHWSLCGHCCLEQVSTI